MLPKHNNLKADSLKTNTQKPTAEGGMMRRWIWIVAFVALALAGVFAAPTVPMQAQQQESTLFPPGIVTIVLTPATLMPFPTDQCVPPLPFAIGDQIVLRAGVNVRNIPSLNGAVVAYFDLPVRVRVAEGPVCANGFNWWRVTGIREPGWVAEGRPDNYLLRFPIGGDDAEDACTVPLDISIGEQVRLLSGLRVREEPNENALVLTVIPFQSLLTVVGGPVCSGGMNYWQVQAPFGDSGQLVTGWIAEGPDYGYYLEPTTRPLFDPSECFPPLTLQAGERIIVLSEGGILRNLRAGPSETAPLLATLIGGVQLTIIEGPLCNDNFNWWRAQVFGGSSEPIGWIAEGTPQNRFIAEVRPPLGPPP
jgi:hypothetical protein